MDARVESRTNGNTKLSVRDLNFYYGSFHALKGISLDIPEKKVTAFIGPSCSPIPSTARIIRLR